MKQINIKNIVKTKQVKKILIIFLFFIFSFQSWTQANDIQDFEIEGMSIGDSLFEHFSKKDIENSLNNKTHYKDKSFFEIFLNTKNSDFDFLQVALRAEDQSYKIQKIMLLKNFSNQIENCKKFKKKFINDSLDFLDNSERIDDDRKALADPSGKSYVYISSFYLPSGGIFNFSCTDYDEEIIKKRGWFDSFKVSIGSKEMTEYLLSDRAY